MNKNLLGWNYVTHKNYRCREGRNCVRGCRKGENACRISFSLFILKMEHSMPKRPIISHFPRIPEQPNTTSPSHHRHYRRRRMHGKQRVKLKKMNSDPYLKSFVLCVNHSWQRQTYPTGEAINPREMTLYKEVPWRCSGTSGSEILEHQEMHGFGQQLRRWIQIFMNLTPFQIHPSTMAHGHDRTYL